MDEVWKAIPSLANLVEVSSEGRVRTLEIYVRFLSKRGDEFFRRKKQKIKPSQIQNGGYAIVHLKLNGERRTKTVHSLVAEAFIGPRPPHFDVCHNNGVRTDNRPENLRYDTRANNFKDKLAHGTFYDGATGAKLKRSDIAAIRNSEEPVETLAKRFGVAKQAIIRVIKKESWKHI